MSYGYGSARALHGIGSLGSSSSNGMKRTAEHRPYDILSEDATWKKAPTRIQTASTSKPNNVLNPFDRRSGNNLSRPTPSNPIASMVVTEQSGRGSNKRRKTEGFSGLADRYPTKYGGSEDKQQNGHPPGRRAIPSTVQTSSRRGQKVSKYYGGLPANGASTSFPGKPATSSTQVISIEESESEGEVDLGVVISRSKPIAKSDSWDEIDLIDHPMDQSSHNRVPHTQDRIGRRPWSNMNGVREGSSRDASRKQFSSLGSDDSTIRSTQPLRLAEDGPSTSRLDNKLRSHTRWSQNHQVLSSPLTSPPPLPTKTRKEEDEVEEVEDADDFPRISKPSSSEIPAVNNSEKRVADRARSPGTWSISQGRVRETANQTEPQPRFIADLKQTGQSLRTRMKGKAPAANASKQMKVPASQTDVASRDKLATASTSYIKNLALPLELFIWGSRKSRLESSSTQPDYWFYWNGDASELQIHEHPPPGPTTQRKKTPLYSIAFSVLGNAEIKVSDASDLHLLRIDFEKEFRDLPDDIRTEGLTFKFISRHGNITEWGTVTSQLKNLLSKNGRKPEILRGSNAKGCLESALQSVEIAETKARRKGKEPSKPLDGVENNSVKSGCAEETGAGAAKKKQPKPRPAHGKNHDIAQMLAFGPPRRSSRLSNGVIKQDAKEQVEEQGEPPSNLDELILVYPYSGQGAVNITTGDLRRLEPAEFLNDTLIEFGLKLWLNDLRQEQPELADSIHVFSSFFFKKLASKSNKTPEDAHKSVSKWTAKVDIFKKKFIIVPINENIHWYLALIYRPGHILEPAPPKSAPRSSKRLSDAATSSKEHSTSQDGALASSPTTEAEAEVEGLVDGPVRNERSIQQWRSRSSVSVTINQATADESRMSVDQPERREVTEDPAVVDDSLSEDSDNEEIDQLDEDDEPSTSRVGGNGSTTPMPSSTNAPISLEAVSDDGISLMDVDESSGEVSLQYPIPDGASSHSFEHVNPLGKDTEPTQYPVAENEDEHDKAVSTVTATSFYGRGRPSGNIRTYDHRKRAETSTLPAPTNQQDDADELDIMGLREPESEGPETVEVTERPQTIIFSMDSLNNVHSKALSRLNDYLQEEAKDKKCVKNPSPALTKKAMVPFQPNYCDCGLYLLHFAQTFVLDPDKYKAAIFSSKRTPSGDRSALWLNEQVGTMRERMKERILAESAEWKKLKVGKERKELESKTSTSISAGVSVDSASQPVQVKESDDEIEVSEVRHIGSSPKRQTRAARLR